MQTHAHKETHKVASKHDEKNIKHEVSLTPEQKSSRERTSHQLAPGARDGHDTTYVPNAHLNKGMASVAANKSVVEGDEETTKLSNVKLADENDEGKAKKTKTPPPLTKDEQNEDRRWAIDQVRSIPVHGSILHAAFMAAVGDSLGAPKEVYIPEYVLDERGWRHKTSDVAEVRDEYDRVLKSNSRHPDRHAKWESAVAYPESEDMGEAPPKGKLWKIEAGKRAEGVETASPDAPVPLDR